MYTIHLGLFPFTAMIAGGLLYAVFRLWLRMRCSCKMAQRYIVISVLVSILFLFASPFRLLQQDSPIDPQTGDIYESSSLSDRRQAPVTNHVSPAKKANKDTYQKQVVSKQRPTFLTSTDLSEENQPWQETISNSISMLNQDTTDMLSWVYGIGFICIIFHFLAQLIWLRIQRKHADKTGTVKGTDIYSTYISMPFSCGGSIFLPKNLDEKLRPFVMMHEQSHVRHHHFIKLCGMELLLAINWFNPFVWLFISELKIQQEREVDEDVIAQGQNRKAYQFSLVQVAMNSSRWLLIQSHFGPHPLKLRVLFMNQRDDTRRWRRNVLAASALSLAIIALIMTMACQTHQEQKSTPVDGVWTMDWFSTAKDIQQYRPERMFYLAQRNHASFYLSYMSRSDSWMHFNYYAEEFSWKDSTICTPAHHEQVSMSEGGHSLFITYPSFPYMENEHTDNKNLLVKWSKAEPDNQIEEFLRGMQTAQKEQGSKFSGVWRMMRDHERNHGFMYQIPADNDSIMHSVYVCFWPGHMTFFTLERFKSRKIRMKGMGDFCDIQVITPDSINTMTKEMHHLSIKFKYFDDGTIQIKTRTDFGKDYRIEGQGRFERTKFPDDLRMMLSSLPQK